MKRFYTLLVLFIALTSNSAPAQENNKNTVKVTIKNEETGEVVTGATVSVKDTEIKATTGANGTAKLSNIPDGEQTCNGNSRLSFQR